MSGSLCLYVCGRQCARMVSSNTDMDISFLLTLMNAMIS